MVARKCSACGHTMGVTHAQYTQCPANIAKNTPTTTNVLVSSIPTVDIQKMSHSSVGTAFALYEKNPKEEEFTAENILAIMSMSESLPKEQQLQLLDKAYTQLNDEEKLKLIRLFKVNISSISLYGTATGEILYEPDIADISGFFAEDKLEEQFLIQVAQDPNTSNKMVKELRKWPWREHYYQYPEHMLIARKRGMFGWLWKQQFFM